MSPEMVNSKLSFSEKVYQLVKLIPQGQTLTYQEVARLVGSSLTARAVGML